MQVMMETVAYKDRRGDKLQHEKCSWTSATACDARTTAIDAGDTSSMDGCMSLIVTISENGDRATMVKRENGDRSRDSPARERGQIGDRERGQIDTENGDISTTENGDRSTTVQ
jgi:hypothetical protein